MSDRPEISVVVPVFNEAGNAARLCESLDVTLQAIGRRCEIIFVDDGSSDSTAAELRALLPRIPQLRIIELDGNFGEAAALSAGFQSSRGALVITLDGDGQNDPRDIPHLLSVFEERKLDAVSGWRQCRAEGFWLRVLPSRIANRLIAWVTRLPVHDNGCGLKAYRRDLVTGVQLPPGFHRFLPAILAVRPERFAEVPVHDRPREHGASHYGLSRTLIVIRDLLALPFILAAPRYFMMVWSAMTLSSAAAAGVATVKHQPLAAPLFWLLTLSAGTIVWNLWRYDRAQRHGVFRVRDEVVYVAPSQAKIA